ncbi:MAG: M81 family metallopeptidase [Candidatus Bathyarchaeota archaeon]|nr:M81 family metallopeptidase [Candidatus Bathyarchaeota archaeon]
MRIAVGGFGAESNAFSVESPVSLAKKPVSARDLVLENEGKKTVIGGFLDVLDEAGADVLPTLRVFWGATGIVARRDYEHFKTEMVETIRKGGKLDGILLDLHGAMSAEDVPDAEGVLLREIRKAVGDKVPVMAVLDLHGNITDLKLQMADALLGYKTNPHVDLYERARKAAQLLLGVLEREVKPVMRLERLPMLGPNLGMSTWAYRPEDEERLPFSRIMRSVSALEDQPGILDISVFIGFPYADISECLTSVLAISDDSPHLAQETADTVAQMVWKCRHEFVSLRPLVPVDEAVERAMNAPSSPVILVDVADNSGGGAPCDNTVILEALIRKGAEDAVVPIRDPEAVALAMASGVGSLLELEVGGKIDRRFYKPVRIKARVKALFDGRYVIRGPYHGGYRTREMLLPKDAWGSADVGKTVLLKAEGVEIIVSEGRVGMEQDYYKAAGVDPAQRKIVVVKSAQAHRASFESIAKLIVEVDTPGSVSPSYRGLIFKNVPRPVFPLDSI